MMMSSIGKTWRVPHRQVTKADIARFEQLVIEGFTVQEMADTLGRNVSYIRNFADRHTSGLRRLRHDALVRPE